MPGPVRLQQTAESRAGENAPGKQGTFGCCGRHRGYFQGILFRRFHKKETGWETEKGRSTGDILAVFLIIVFRPD
jgi:hypothetical protein